MGEHMTAIFAGFWLAVNMVIPTRRIVRRKIAGWKETTTPPIFEASIPSDLMIPGIRKKERALPRMMPPPSPIPPISSICRRIRP
jgi:hypothetical protein